MIKTNAKLLISPGLLEMIHQDAEDKIDKALKETVVETLRLAKEMVPVDTGALRSSGRWRHPSNLKYTVTFGGYTRVAAKDTVDYALIVHEGLGKGANSVPRRYLTIPFDFMLEAVLRPRLKELVRNHKEFGTMVTLQGGIYG